MVVPAPGRFSTMTGCPSRWPSFWPTRRPSASDDPPGAKGTTSFTGLAGYGASAACTNGATSAAMHAARAAMHAATAPRLLALTLQPAVRRDGRKVAEILWRRALRVLVELCVDDGSGVDRLGHALVRDEHRYGLLRVALERILRQPQVVVR